MTFKKIIFFIPITLIGIFVSAQTIRVDAQKNVKDDAFDKSQSILPVYKYTPGQLFGPNNPGPPSPVELGDEPLLETCLKSNSSLYSKLFTYIQKE